MSTNIKSYYNTEDNISKDESKDINSAQLLPYLTKVLPNEFKPDSKKQLLIYNLVAGNSNSPYVLRYDNTQYLLRKCTDAPLIQIDENKETQEENLRKQYDICKLLADKYDFPVPKMYHFCDDETIIGKQFYIMQFLKGRVIYNQNSNLYGYSINDRRQIHSEIMNVMTKLHNIDINKYGLKKIIQSSKQMKYTPINIINRWKNSFVMANKDENVADNIKNKMKIFFDTILQYYDEKINKATEEKQLCLVHGDIHPENIIWHSQQNKIIGLVDWEGGILGNPLLDLAYFATVWNVNPMILTELTLPENVGGSLLDFKTLGKNGIPTRMQLVQSYVLKRNDIVMNDIKHWNFYNGLIFCRLIALFYQIFKQNPNSALGKEFNPFLLIEIYSTVGLDVMSKDTFKLERSNRITNAIIIAVGISIGYLFYKNYKKA